MAYPPTLPPSTRTNSTLRDNNHKDDHNLAAAALAEIVDRLKPRHVHVRRTTAQPVGANALELVIFNSELEDAENMWASGAPGRLTFNTAGLWRVTGAVEWLNPATASGNRSVRLTPSTGETTLQSGDAAPNYGTGQTVSRTYRMPVGAYVEMHVRHNAASTVDLTAGLSFLQADYIGP